nr:AbiV family abortive infection protein [uncultured Flavobacterium sp.]
MNTFINLTAQNSKGIDYTIYKNARQLRKDALLIAEINKSFASATSLLTLSSEEVIKSILVLLHSQGYKTYLIKDSKKFFSDHRVRHQLAQLMELSIGILESIEKKVSNEPVTLLKSKSEFWNGLVNGILEIALASKPFLDSAQRVKKLMEFNDKKNQGLYVDFRDKLLIPQIEISESDFIETRLIVNRIFNVYKGLKIIFNPKVQNHFKNDDIEFLKNQLRVFVDEALKDYSFQNIK